MGLPFMSADSVKREIVNQRHLWAPQPGDYWHEMFVPHLVVLGVVGDQIFYLDERRDLGNKWTWEIKAKPKRRSLSAWRKMMTYSISGRLGRKTSSDVHPCGHAWVLKHMGAEDSPNE